MTVTLDQEIAFWKAKMESTPHDKLAMLCFGMATGLKFAKADYAASQTGDPDMPNLSLCSFEYLAAELRRRGATITPAPHGGDFANTLPSD